MIGRSPRAVALGDDLPGAIHQSPGGVALNVARALARLGHRPALLSAIGQDAQGDALVAQIRADGVDTSLLHRPNGLTTDRYLAIESPQGLVAAIADSSTLEHASAELLAPLRDGGLAGWQGKVVLDSGLAPSALAALAAAAVLDAADLRLTCAAPAKAARLAPFLNRRDAMFYLNLAEAGALLARDFPDSASATQALVQAGAARAIVTDGARSVSDADNAQTITHTPTAVAVQRVTGAGDIFMASHIAAEARGCARGDALATALRAAAHHITTQTI